MAGITQQVVNSSNINGASVPSTLTLPSSYSTSAGDCIILTINVQSTLSLTASGCGATWTTYQVQVGGMTLAVIVGYGCTAGGTTISLSGAGGSNYEGSIVVYSGMASGNPVVAAPSTASSASATSVTTGSQSFSTGQLIFGAGGEIFSGRFWTPAPHDANSPALNLLWQGTTDSLVWTGSVVAGSSGTTGGFTATQTGNAQPMAAIHMVFAAPAANQGNFLALMGA